MEELQTVVGKMAEDAASGNDSPAGIPPQRAKPAGVKPDPKARPFTPGVGLCTFVLTNFSQQKIGPFRQKNNEKSYTKRKPRNKTTLCLALRAKNLSSKFAVQHDEANA